MADKMKKPVMAELAKANRGSRIADGFSDVLAPTDQILREKGGSFDVYREVLRDDQVKSTFQQRRLALTSKEWFVDPGGDTPLDEEAANALKENLEQIGWDNITEKMMYAVFYGFGVGEVLWEAQESMLAIKDLKVRDRGRFRFSKDQNKLYLIDSPGKYIPMPDRKFWVLSTGADTDDEPYGMGLAHYLYWPVFFKRAGIKFWMIFLEKFGQPSITAKAPWGDIEDETKRNKILEFLNTIQVESAAVMPESVAVELLEATRGGSADYSTMCAHMDMAIAKIVLSQVMTTEAVGGQYKADVHKEVRDEVVEADGDLICESFRNSVATWWTEYNYPGAAVPKIWRDTEPEEDLKDRVTRDKGIYEIGFEPTEEYIRETYGEGFVKREISGPAFDGIQSPEFVEMASLAARKAGHRQDQQDLVTAASVFASKYNEVIGERINEIVAYADETNDYATFRTRLNELLAELPKPEAVERVQRSGVFARLMGMLRQDRG